MPSIATESQLRRLRPGDRLLAQIVKQISPRLTQKVQQDFHTRLN